MQNKIIITADDYGMCPAVNTAIEECVKQKIVLSTNVMVNMPDASDAVSLKTKYPYLSLGLHFNFTVGKPLCEPEEVASLVDKNGNFLSYSKIREKCKNGTYNYDEVKKEMKAQWQKYVELCGQPDYWNTHENVHVYPGLFQLFSNEALLYGVNKMRSHQRIILPSSNGKSDKSLKWKLTNPLKQKLLNKWMKANKKNGITAPDGLIVRMNEKDKLNLPYLFKNLRWKDNKIAEIAIHPSVDSNNEFFGEITDLRVREYECFSNENVLKIAKEAEIELVGFEKV